MAIQERSEGGKFAPKSDQPREVRSIRLTDKTWATLGDIAERRRITRADLIEELVEEDKFSAQAQLTKDVVQVVVAEVLEDPKVTRNGKDRGSVKRALEALLKRLF